MANDTSSAGRKGVAVERRINTAVLVVPWVVFIGALFIVGSSCLYGLFTPPSDQNMIGEVFSSNMPGLQSIKVTDHTLNRSGYWKEIRIEAVLDTAQGLQPCTGTLTLGYDDPRGTQAAWDDRNCTRQFDLIASAHEFIQYDLSYAFSADDRDPAIGELLAHWVVQGKLHVEDIQDEMFRKEVLKAIADQKP